MKTISELKIGDTVKINGVEHTVRIKFMYANGFYIETNHNTFNFSENYIFEVLKA